MKKYQIYPKHERRHNRGVLESNGHNTVALLETLGIPISHPLQLTEEEVLLITMALDPELELREYL